MAKEVQMAARAANSTARTTPPHHHHSGGGGGGAATAGKPVPGYLRPSAGSCHHVCKYGGTHTFDDKEAKKPHHHPKPARRQPPPPPAPAPQPESQSRMMVKVRSVFRRRVGDSSRAAEKAAATAKAAAAGKAKESGEGVEWKDIVAYDSTVVPPHGSSSPQPEKISAPVAVSGDGKKKNDVTKGKKSSRDKAKITTGQVDGVQLQTQDEKAMVKNAKIDTKSVKPPKGKKKPKSLLVEKHPIDDQDTPLHGYQVLSPSLLQSRASLLHELEEEMVNEDTNNMKETKPTYSLDEEECAAAAETSSRPIPAHRRAKSMSISSRSVRFPFVRQASKNSATFKLRSRSTKAPPILPLEEEKKLVRLRSRRGEDPAGSTGRGIQLRIRSLRRRGVGGSGGSGTGFVVPAVALRHQKTLEKKRSQRLYNNMIEETAGKLVKARKSRVKALVGAFESVISKIAK